MKLSYVELLFADNFGAHIRGDHIGKIYISNIQPGFSGMAGEAAHDDFAGNVAIEIHKNANNESNADELDLFSRICAYNDITCVRFQFENDRKLYNFRVNTAFQSAYISLLGHLYIVISKSFSLDDFFDVLSLDDKEKVDMHFNLPKEKNKNNEQ